MSQIIAKKTTYKCGNCHALGHNRATCSQPVPTEQERAAEEAVKKAEQEVEKARAAVKKIAEEKKAAAERAAEEKKAAEEAERKAEQDRKVAEILAAEKKAAAEEKKVWTEVVKHPKAQPKKDPVLQLIFEKLYDRKATLEYLNLRKHWQENPEDFKMLGTEHYSNHETQKHYTFEVRTKFNFTHADGTDGTKTWMSYYHLYYIINPVGKLIWTDLTTTDRNSNAYTLAKFNNPS